MRGSANECQKGSIEEHRVAKERMMTKEGYSLSVKIDNANNR